MENDKWHWHIEPARFMFVRKGPEVVCERVLCLDTGKNTGWAVRHLGDHIKPYASIAAGGMFRSEEVGKELFRKIGAEVTYLINYFRPHRVVLEQGFHGKGAFNSFSIEMRGAVKLAIEQFGTPWGDISPSTTRSMIGGNYRGCKDCNRRELISNMYEIPLRARLHGWAREKLLPIDVFDAVIVANAAEDVRCKPE